MGLSSFVLGALLIKEAPLSLSYRGTTLQLRFAIAFDAFGRAEPLLDLVPDADDVLDQQQQGGDPSEEEEAARAVLRELPMRYRQMIRHRPGWEEVRKARRAEAGGQEEEEEEEVEAIVSITLSLVGVFFGADV